VSFLIKKKEKEKDCVKTLNFRKSRASAFFNYIFLRIESHSSSILFIGSFFLVKPAILNYKY
jgi:hypothetical protein